MHCHVTDYTVREVSLSTVRNFIETNHYSKSVNGCKVSICVGLFKNENLVGAVLFGALSTTAWKKYASSESDVVELRRLVCVDDCPKNTESFLIAKSIRLIKKMTSYKIVVSYADPFHGHIGTIYQAANWSYMGETSPDVLLRTESGKTYHSRAMRTTYNGKLKPFAAALKEMYASGTLEVIPVPGKHIYIYNLVGKQERTGLPYPKGDDAKDGV